MSKNTKSRIAAVPVSQPQVPPQVSETIASLPEPIPQIQKLIASGRVEEALQVAVARNSGSPMVQNARAVCLMRLGRQEEAVRVLRSAILANGGIDFRTNVPEVYKVNFATALTLQGNITGAWSILQDLQHPGAPQASALLAAIGKWQRGLSWWSWLMWKLGIDTAQPVILDFDPGTIC